jgi:hypothetical protein
MKRVSVLFVSSILVAVSGSAVQAAKVESRDGCVNLRAEPSIAAKVSRCLSSGTTIEPLRLGASGRFAWQKEGDRLWYYASVPSTAEKGWMMPDCTDINGVNKGTCTDTGSAVPLANPQQPQRVAQGYQQEEMLKNPSWKVVPDAAVGKNSADTFMNLNGLNRNGNTVTFDIIGYQSSYNRLEGNCSDRQVRFLRRGIYRGLRSGISEKGALDLYVNYRSVTGEEASGAGEFHRKILDFACKQSETPIARSPSGASTRSVEAGNGVIEGKVAYPSDYLPAMTVCAQSTSNFQSMSCINTQEQQRTFKLTVKPGEYFVFSHAKNGFTDGNTGKKHDAFFYYAKNNTPISVRVSAGALTSDITPRDQRVCNYNIPKAAYCTVPQSESIALASEAKISQPSQVKPSTAKIAEGVYWIGATGMGLRVRGGQYQRYEEGGESPWKPISELTFVKDGVLKSEETHWCLSTLPQPKNSRSSVCSANGWTASPSIAVEPSGSFPESFRSPFPPIISPASETIRNPQNPPANFSDTPLTGDENRYRDIIKESRDRLTITLGYNNSKICNHAGQNIGIKITRGKYPDSWTGVRNYQVSGCFKEVKLVNLDSDKDLEIVIVFRNFNRNVGVIIIDGCGECNQGTYAVISNSFILDDLNMSGFSLKDIDADIYQDRGGDGIFEFVSDDLPVRILQFYSELVGKRYVNNLVPVTTEKKFRLWYAHETARRLREEFPRWKEALTPCPCTVDGALDPSSQLVESNILESAIESTFHPGGYGKRFFRSTRSVEYTSPSTGRIIRPGQQCVYGSKYKDPLLMGDLITHGLAAGTPDAFAPEDTPAMSYRHTWTDVTPFNILKEEGGGVNVYHQTWTPNKGMGHDGRVCPVNQVP